MITILSSSLARVYSLPVQTLWITRLQNFLELRTSKHALKEIQELARNMFEALPDDHKFLFEGYINNLCQTAIAMQELIQGDK